MPSFYFAGFWPDFYSSSLEKEFIMNLFSDERNWETVPQLAQYAITSVFNLTSLTLNEKSKWIHISFEPFANLHERQNLAILTFKQDKTFYLPFAVFYMHLRNLTDRFLKPIKVTKIPEKFCCFLSSSAYGLPSERKKMFEKLSEYKKVDSWGAHLNNMGRRLSCDYHSEEFLDFLSEYKFIIAFENKKIPGYFTEKIINPLVSGIIPIYWGSEDVKNIINPERFLYIDDIDDNNKLQNIIQKIKELDQDNKKYLEMVNKQNFINDNDLFHLEKIKKNIRAMV